ncbi:hypothetical protein C1645_740944 [Glomus cerebriforme]|uniref:BTB domain-containing protein n=1 Tax=Glomus cerebriforme TaxID=658196 RepID=A0A397SKY6_9GLOM|nr:hypothetical protein C1645_740944 [Glomus cerebriforme]
MVNLKFYSSLLKDLSSMYKTSSDFDIIIRVGTNQNVKEFRVHSNILRARSEYFKTVLSNEWITRNNDLILPDITPTVFEIILWYIYTSEVKLDKQSEILELIVASDKLHLTELLECAQNNLIRTHPIWVQQNLVLVLHTVFPITNCKKLHDHCIESISADPQFFFNSEDFLSLDGNILHELLKRDDLLIEEVTAWDFLIKWSIEQTPSLGSKNNDRTKWNNENYEELKKTLRRFIPLIRFSEMSSADFFNKVRPYKAVIPTNIYEEAMEFHMKGTLSEITTILPPRLGTMTIKSNIINSKLAYVIANWIEKKDAKAIRNRNNCRYNFDLLYRSSRDGLNAFRDKCKNLDSCLILIKPQSYVQKCSPQKSLNNYRVPQRTNRNIGYAAQQNNRNSSWNTSQSKRCASSDNHTTIYGEYYSREFKFDELHSKTEYTLFSFANDNDVNRTEIHRGNYIYHKNVKTKLTHISKRNNFGVSFHMEGNHICVNNSTQSNTVVDSNIKILIPKEIEIFKIFPIKW